MEKLLDTHGRLINYLRLSVTDRCNLRCAYCHSSEEFIDYGKVLRYKEMEKVINTFVQLGVEKLRFTGGEPFVRQGFIAFLQKIRVLHPDLAIRVTTNGVLTAPYVKLLNKLKITVNLSLDTLQPEKFKKITGFDKLKDVLKTLDVLLEEQIPFKLNAVALKGVNDDELPAFLDLATKYPLDMRFIEFMPIGDNTIWTEGNVWKSEEILESARTIVGLEELTHNNATDGPARMFKVANGRGRFGVISPMTNHYCLTCNRLRVTSDGNLRTCLYDDKEYSLRHILRDETLNPEMQETAFHDLIENALENKPIGANILKERPSCNAVARRSMFSIGG